MKKIHKGKITKTESVAKDIVYIEFAPGRAMEISPGQFVSVLCDGLALRRPFSVASFKDGKVGILFKKKGKGTEYLSRLMPGDEIDFIGALGNGFVAESGKSLLIGAGIGIAPIFYLKQSLLDVEQRFVGAFMTDNDIPKGFEPNEVITNDGSKGKKGSILDYLEEIVREYKPEIIYACGPSVVLKSVCKIAKKYGIKSQVALEKVMACGIGVCKGCVIKVHQGDNVQNKTICHDGPVFDGGEVVWE